MTATTKFAATDAPHEKGGAPVGGRPQFQDFAMLKVAERPLEGKAKQESLDFLYEGFVRLSAVEMNRVLQVCQYAHQRPVSELHVTVLTDLMARGQWQPKSQIDFALMNGHFILMNGYHRAFAQVRSGKTIEWSIVVHPCKSDADLRALYYAFDTNIRVRGARDILSAYEFAETAGLTAEVANALYGAVPYIASKFEVNPKKKDNLTTKAVDRRLALANEYAKAAARYAACLEGLGGPRRKRLLNSAVAAVAVITFKYQSESAWQFWLGVAQNDGLKRGDPRHALAMDLLSRNRSGGAGTMHSFGPAMIAWNAFYEDRQLQLIRMMPESFVPRIEGTPFDGKKKV